MSGEAPNTFKVVQLNAENLFLFLDDLTDRDWRNLSEKEWQSLSRATVPNKSLVKTLWLADTLLDLNADIVCMNEVGGEESLKNFARFFLKERYRPFLVEGNSDRGIDIGYLVRADFPLRAELRSHKDRPIQFLYPHERQMQLFDPSRPGLKSHYFSRDCAELRLYKEGSKKAEFVMLLVHLKSKLDPEGIDPQGRDRRRAEVNTLFDIYREVRSEENPPLPVLIAGDFNGSARRSQLSDEFVGLISTDLESVVDLAGLEGEDAATQLQFNRGGNMHAMQIDFIFISPELKPHLIAEEVSVFRYQSDLKVALPLPRTMEQRTYLPSDHFPVVATFRRFF